MFDWSTVSDPASPLHLQNMERALGEAQLAAADDEVPVGCVVYSVERETIIATGRNRKHRQQNPLAHAEMLAIARAADVLQSWRLEQCILYVTLEPCPMCAGAIVQARLPAVVYGCTDLKAGACHSLYQITSDARLNHRCEVVGGVMASECASVLSQFFAGKRALGKK